MVLKPMYCIDTLTLPSGILAILNSPLSSVIPPVMVSPAEFRIITFTYGSGSLSFASITLPDIEPSLRVEFSSGCACIKEVIKSKHRTIDRFILLD